MADRPNLLFLMADQLRPQSCGYAGDPRAETPNLDRLAREGVDFQNAVSMHPVCGPFRASLFTGCYSSTTGYVINELAARTDLPTLAGTLTAAGAACAYFGKWHLYASEAKPADDAGRFHANPANQFVPPGPDRLGFDAHWAAYNFNHSYNDGFFYEDTPQRRALPGYEPDAITDLVLDHLDRAGEEPFFTCVSYGTPHQPWTEANIPAAWLDRFRDVDFPLPPNYADGEGRYWHGWYDEAWWAEAVKPHLPAWQRIYAAMTANLDWNVGRLLDRLEARGLADNTIVVFTSDHGEMFGAHGRVQKNIFYDEAARVPLLLRWPGRIPAGTRSDACINTPDLMPTLLGLLGVDAPAGIEGMDLSGHALGHGGPEPTAAFLQGMGPSVDWDDGHEWRALRDRRYTYAVHRADGREELYDNLRDPLQMENRIADPAAAAVRDRLRAELCARMDALGDTFRPVTWYREHWIRDGYAIERGARG